MKDLYDKLEFNLYFMIMMMTDEVRDSNDIRLRFDQQYIKMLSRFGQDDVLPVRVGFIGVELKSVPFLVILSDVAVLNLFL